MLTTAHPVTEALEHIGSLSLEKHDQVYFASMQPTTEYECNMAAARLMRYPLTTELDAALTVCVEEQTAKLTNDSGVPPTICVGSKNYFVLRHVDRSNKDAVKALAEHVTGKRALLWNLPEHPGVWAIHRKHVAALLATCYVILDQGIRASDYDWNVPATPTVPVPAIDWNQLQPMRQLRHFQQEGVEFLLPAMAVPGTGAILADDQGLGKTIQALTVANAFGQGLVIICPAGVRYNWANEVFLTHPTWKVCIFGDKARFRTLKAAFGTKALRIAHMPNKADVIIMSYEATKGLVCGNADPIASRHNTMKMMALPHLVDMFKDRIVVCDEAQYAKNVDAKRAQSTLALCRAGNRVLCMTGTPIMNRPDELWTLLCAINRNRDIAGSAADFKASYSRGKNYAELNRRIVEGRFMLRRLKKDVLKELPAKQRQDFLVEMSPRQQLEYESLRQGLKTQVKSGGMAKNGTCILALLTNMQTLANKAKVAPIVDELVERCAEGYLTVVQCTRTDPLHEMKGLLEAQGIKAEMIIGGTSDSDRKRIPEDFKAGKIQVVLTTLAEGINLQAADKMYLLDLDWSPAKISQREDRIHRFGQTEHVMIVRVLAASIDHHKKNVVASKQEIIDQVIDGGDSAHADDEIMAEVIRRLVDED